MLNSEPAQIGLRERNRRAKLERIERAGRELFARDGFEGTATREIAERAGIGTGTLFLYFPEKRDLLIHLFKADVAPVQRRAFAAVVGPEVGLGDALERVFRTFYRHYARDVRLSRVYLKEILFLDGPQRAEMTEFTVEFLRELAARIESSRERGELAPDTEPMAAAYCAFSIYCLTLLHWLGGAIPSLRAAEAQLHLGLGVLLDGIAARKTPPRVAGPAVRTGAIR